MEVRFALKNTQFESISLGAKELPKRSVSPRLQKRFSSKLFIPESHFHAFDFAKIEDFLVCKDIVNLFDYLGIEFYDLDSIDSVSSIIQISDSFDSGAHGTIHTSSLFPNKVIKNVLKYPPNINMFTVYVGLFCQNLLHHYTGSVPRIYDFIESKDRYLVVMDKVQGIPLNEYIFKQKLTVKHRLDLFTQLICLFQKMLSLNIIHGDISAKNIMIGSNGRLFLVDFDSALYLRKDVKIEPERVYFHYIEEDLIDIIFQFYYMFLQGRVVLIPKSILGMKNQLLDNIKNDIERGRENISFDCVKTFVEKIISLLECKDFVKLVQNLEEIPSLCQTIC